ncbi:hypothetical protein LWI29_021586 [Acer saccharum]|uniref:Uncharacterized protein n=1 Tax=Acer saccharum TaxID=4024 RepID=A0AA39RFJ9_ACESA|nr:hypothetical protein LWI29_021586 [Acer saccharum]
MEEFIEEGMTDFEQLGWLSDHATMEIGTMEEPEDEVINMLLWASGESHIKEESEKTPMDESSDSSWKLEPYKEVSEGSSSNDSLDGWLVSEDGEPAESVQARHQSGDLGSPRMIFNEPGNKTVTGTDSIEEDQLNQDKGDDNVGMEGEDIAGELERNLEQVSDTHIIDLEPLPSGPSNEKSKDIVQGEANDNLKQSPKPKKSKDIVQGADLNKKVRKPDKGNATKVVTPRRHLD